ncbi:uncharacterized protein K489DRAFT_408759 [Dissoconium aciculare CBS 342.82]|uniref:Uncharacterized protein n=1 Tax=Dissoconium aciculare CBS 342.82 TaxID=1314786 RepID=A0A6J3MC14_9PEZI|nr:uncharacterized protein K489DRAFT_408759 [Dissoconium aciculare CBS 342.82]KAF1824377.1 hypothetical protein K489DRAFT_408759 [Dissoconium aciculare CBS 342.82]
MFLVELIETVVSWECRTLVDPETERFYMAAVLAFYFVQAFSGFCMAIKDCRKLNRPSSQPEEYGLPLHNPAALLNFTNVNRGTDHFSITNNISIAYPPPPSSPASRVWDPLSGEIHAPVRRRGGRARGERWTDM